MQKYVKNSRKILLFLSTAFVALLLVGCGNKNMIQGMVIETTDNQVLIATELTQDDLSLIQSKTSEEIHVEDMDGDKHYGLIWLNSDKPVDFNKGNYVEASIDDAVMQSYPAQVNAKKIKIIE